MYGQYAATYNGYGGSQYQQQIAQNRLNQIESQQYGQPMYQNNYNLQPAVQITQQQYIKGRPVSSFDEAKAMAIDWDGSVFVFTDTANKRIYTKQIMLDGTAELKTYVLDEPVQSDVTSNTNVNNDYVLRSDFESMIQEMKNEIDELKKGGNVDESTRTNVKSNVRK